MHMVYTNMTADITCIPNRDSEPAHPRVVNSHLLIDINMSSNSWG